MTPGLRVGLLAPDPVDLAALLVCLVGAGAVVVPLYPSAPRRARRELLHRAGAKLDVVVSGGTTGSFLRVGPGLTPPRGLPGGGGKGGGGNRGPGGVLLFSSGSTGPRKAVGCPESQLLHVARAVAARAPADPADRGFNPLPLFHVNAEVVGLLAPLVSGGTLVLDGRFHRTGFWDLLRRAAGHLAQRRAGDPRDPRRGDRRGRPLPRACAFVRSASAPLPAPVLERFEQRCGCRSSRPTA